MFIFDRLQYKLINQKTPCSQKYNYLSSFTYLLSFVLHTIILVFLLGYTYNYMSMYDNYVSICD